MPDLNLLRRLAEHTPAPLNGVFELAGGTVSDIAGLTSGLPGDDKLDKRFGPDRMYEQVTGQMQDALTELSAQRIAIPLVG